MLSERLGEYIGLVRSVTPVAEKVRWRKPCFLKRAVVDPRNRSLRTVKEAGLHRFD
jgi:hypothetical protein